MKSATAMIHSKKATDKVVIVSEKGYNDVIVSYQGKLMTAVFNPFVTLYYVDDIYGVLGDDPEKRTSQGTFTCKRCTAGKEIQVLKSYAGYYIGTWEEGPNCRLSVEYFKKKEEAEEALKNGIFTPRICEENLFCAGGRACEERRMT